MKTRQLSLAQVISRAIDVRLADMHTAMPGRVVRYDAGLQQVDVQPLVQAIFEDESGNQVTEPLPIITNVPVIFPGAGGYRITFPIKAGDQDGDTVLVMCSESSLDKWLSQGGLVDPLDGRRFNLSDAVALPGLRDFAHPLKNAPTDAVSLGKDDGITIHIDGTKVKIGTNVTADLEAAALGDTLQSFLNSMRSWAAGHTHSAGTMAAPNGPVTGVTGGPAGAPPTVPTVTSTTVQVKK